MSHQFIFVTLEIKTEKFKNIYGVTKIIKVNPLQVNINIRK